jgi:hypothetical protein
LRPRTGCGKTVLLHRSGLSNNRGTQATQAAPVCGPERSARTRVWTVVQWRLAMAQKGAGGNAGAVTHKGGDGAKGSTGTGRGGGKTGDATKKRGGEGGTGQQDKDA